VPASYQGNVEVERQDYTIDERIAQSTCEKIGE